MAKSPRIIAKTATVVTGVTLCLNSDDTTHLAYALGLARKQLDAEGRGWDWLYTLRKELDTVRSTGGHSV